MSKEMRTISIFIVIVSVMVNSSCSNAWKLRSIHCNEFNALTDKYPEGYQCIRFFNDSIFEPCSRVEYDTVWCCIDQPPEKHKMRIDTFFTTYPKLTLIRRNGDIYYKRSELPNWMSTDLYYSRNSIDRGVFSLDGRQDEIHFFLTFLTERPIVHDNGLKDTILVFGRKTSMREPFRGYEYVSMYWGVTLGFSDSLYDGKIERWSELTVYKDALFSREKTIDCKSILEDVERYLKNDMNVN
jgi:hypothetical protein